MDLRNLWSQNDFYLPPIVSLFVWVRNLYIMSSLFPFLLCLFFWAQRSIAKRQISRPMAPSPCYSLVSVSLILSLFGENSLCYFSKYSTSLYKPRLLASRKIYKIYSLPPPKKFQFSKNLFGKKYLIFSDTIGIKWIKMTQYSQVYYYNSVIMSSLLK